MKITSLNLAGYKDWPERESRVLAYLDKASSDIVFLQEVKFDPNYSPDVQSSHLNKQLRLPYQYHHASISRYYTQSNGLESREGLAVLSKYPVVSSDVIALTKQPDDKHTRIIQKVEVLIDDQIVTFTNVHFSNNKYAADQLSETVQILRSASCRSVVLGDFNIFDLAALSDLYTSDYTATTEVMPYISFPSENVTLDYALLPRDYVFKSLSIGENLSDHNALTFSFSV